MHWVCVNPKCALKDRPIALVDVPPVCQECGMLLERAAWEEWVDREFLNLKILCRNCRGRGCPQCEGRGTVEVVGRPISEE